MRLMQRIRARRESNERGGALVELAISIPLFIGIVALIFDAGLGFSAARSTSSAARSAARAASLAGDARLADFRALDAIRAEFGDNGDNVIQVTVYRSTPGGDGLVPAGCGLGGSSTAGLCNVYDGAMLATLNSIQFNDPDCVGEPDVAWCPTTRADDAGDYLGVSVWSTHTPAVGLGQADDFDLEDRAVFALYFPPTPTP